MRAVVLAAAVAALLPGLSACSNVQPWQRGELAHPTMAWDDDPMKAALDEHVYSSKEASSGRIGLAGGGCGCN